MIFDVKYFSANASLRIYVGYQSVQEAPMFILKYSHVNT